MSVPPENTLADPQQLIADLQRHFAECGAKRDEAPQREIGPAEVLQVINSSPGDLAPVFTIRLLRGKHWATTRDAFGHPPRRNAERRGGRARRIRILPTILTYDGLAQ
jgi:hypothetical protein